MIQIRVTPKVALALLPLALLGGLLAFEGDVVFASAVVNTVLSVMLAGLVAYLLFVFDEVMITVERVGLGLAGGAIILSIAKLWAHGAMTPYDPWYQWVWRVGWMLYLGGRVYRLRTHRRNNQSAKDIAGAWLVGKGRL